MAANSIPVKLNKKDKKILFALDFDARRTNSSIAKEVGLSKQGVEYKIQSLIKKGVITGFYPMIDVTRLDYYYCRIFIKLQNLTREKEEKIINEVISHKKCIWAIKMEGKYDLGMAFSIKNLSEFKEISQYFLRKYGIYIKEKKESVGIDVLHFQNKFLLGVRSGKEAHFSKKIGKIELDPMDWKILHLLSQDARTLLVRIGEILKTSPKVISYRLKKMEQLGVILGYRPSINYDLIGFHHYKIFFYLSNVTEQEYDKFRAYLRSNPNLVYIIDEIGICDLDIEIMLPVDKDVFSFIRELKFKFPKLIRDYDFAKLAKTIKLVYLPRH